MPLRPNRIRHFVNFHNPNIMEYEFDEVGGGPGDGIALSVYTNKRIRELRGDVVWLLSRRLEGPPYVLYGRFKVQQHGQSDHPDYKYEIAGIGTCLRKPIVTDTLPWFRRLLEVNPNLSQGFQSVTEPAIIKGLDESFRAAKRAQF